jgi:hypothetical protein
MEPELPGTAFLHGLSSDPAMLAAAGATLAAIGGTDLAVILTAIVRLIRRSVVARVPVAEAHVVDLGAAGAYALHLEGPMLSRVPGGPILQFFGVQLGGPRLSLREEATGAEVPLHAPLVPVRSSGFSRARHQVRAFQAPQAGRYVLACEGVDPERDWSQWAFLVTRPYAARMLALVLTAIVGLITFMAGAVLLGWWAMIRLGI